MVTLRVHAQQYSEKALAFFEKRLRMLEGLLGRLPTVEELAQEFNISTQQVDEYLAALVDTQPDFGAYMVKHQAANPGPIRVEAQAVVYEPGSLPETSLAEPLTEIKHTLSDLYVLYTQLKNLEKNALEEANQEAKYYFDESEISELAQEDAYIEVLSNEMNQALKRQLEDLKYNTEDITEAFMHLVTTDPEFEALIQNAGVDTVELIRTLEAVADVQVPDISVTFYKLLHEQPILDLPFLPALQEAATKLYELTQGAAAPEDQEEAFYERFGSKLRVEADALNPYKMRKILPKSEPQVETPKPKQIWPPKEKPENPSVYEGDFVMVEGNYGTEWVNLDYVKPDELEKLKEQLATQGEASLEGTSLHDYCENDVVYGIDVTHGWAALEDIGELTVFDTRDEAIEHLQSIEEEGY